MTQLPEWGPRFPETPLNPDRPLAVSPIAYLDRLALEWPALLATTPDERTMQRFLEFNVCLLPGGLGLGGVSGGKGPFRRVIFRQPTLNGITRRVPDFMWVAHNSATFAPTCIEIERPGKYWFNVDGTPTAHLTQAIDRLREWQAWFAEPENVLWFRRAYRLNERAMLNRSFEPLFILIYGRSSEFEDGGRHANASVLNKKRMAMQKANELFMTYDRLELDPRMFESFCASRTEAGFVAHAIPPTFTTGPHLIKTVHEFSGWMEAIMNSPGLSKERREFLVERMAYWLEQSKVFANGGYSYDASYRE